MVNIEFKSKREEHLGYKVVFILLGLSFIVPGIFKLINQHTVKFDTDFFITVFNILVGIVSLLHGLNIINVSVRKVVRIDDNKLYFNASSVDKTDTLSWNEIDSIELSNNKLNVSLKNKEIREINLDWIPHKDLISIKNEIEKLSNEKNLEFKRI